MKFILCLALNSYHDIFVKYALSYHIILLSNHIQNFKHHDHIIISMCMINDKNPSTISWCFTRLAITISSTFIKFTKINKSTNGIMKVSWFQMIITFDICYRHHCFNKKQWCRRGFINFTSNLIVHAAMQTLLMKS